MSVVTRFAPSPSGALHIGGARTALFNYIFAKSKNGIFRLRIENTDVLRQTKSSVSSIIDGLKWLDILPDKEIVFQDKNISEHLQVIDSLLKKKLAYKCFTSNQEIESFTKQNKHKKFRSKWRDLDQKDHPKNKSFVIRLKIPLESNITIVDTVQGKVSVDNKEIDDSVILRANGKPTFLLSSAVDDINMKVTNIIRGDDHLTNTFRQFYIFDFLNKTLPIFSHIPLILNANGKKLSKRDNASSLEDYRNKGYLKEAIINYLLRLGWSHGNKEIIDIVEAKKLFNIKKIGKSPAKLDENKINYLNSYYLKNLPINLINDLLIQKINVEHKLSIQQIEMISKVSKYYVKRSSTISDLYKHTKFLYAYNYKSNLQIKNKKFEMFSDLKNDLIAELKKISEWEVTEIDNMLKEFVNERNISYKDIGIPLRIILTDEENTPSIGVIIQTLGKNEVLRRIENYYSIHK